MHSDYFALQFVQHFSSQIQFSFPTLRLILTGLVYETNNLFFFLVLDFGYIALSIGSGHFSLHLTDHLKWQYFARLYILMMMQHQIRQM